MKTPQKKCESCPYCGIYCTGKTAFCNPPIPSPTQPDTESWEEEFKKDFCQYIPYLDTQLIAWKGTKEKNMNLIPTANTVIEWFHQVEEKAYQRGLKENCIAVDKANMGWLKGLAPETSDFLKSFVEQGRQSTLREILEMVEGMKPIYHENKYPEDFIVGFYAFKEQLKEKLQ